MITTRIQSTFLILFLLSSLTLQAQITRIDTITNSKKSTFSKITSPRLYTYTIGLKVFSLEEFPKILNQINSNEFVSAPLRGAFIKINDNQISYRLSADFYSDNITFNNECEDCEVATGKVKDFSGKIGFEKNFIYGMLQPYLAFDIGYRRNSFDGKVESGTIPNYTNPYNVTSLKNGFLMSPNFGLKFNPINHFTIGIETGLSLLYSYEKQERVYQDANSTRTFNDYKKWEFLLKPLSAVSIQYNFGIMY